MFHKGIQKIKVACFYGPLWSTWYYLLIIVGLMAYRRGVGLTITRLWVQLCLIIWSLSAGYLGSPVDR